MSLDNTQVKELNEQDRKKCDEYCSPIFADLVGKRVIVTGGSAGIGKATALAFSKNGAIVTIMARTLSKLEETVAQFTTKGYYVQVDLNDVQDMKRAVREAVDKMGGVDILINNGAPSNAGTIQNPADVEILQHMFHLHVISCMVLMNECKEELVKNRGSVVNVSSMSSEVINGDRIPYCIAKAAEDAMTRCMALAWAGSGVRVNSVNPGRVDTPSLAHTALQMGISYDQFLSQSSAAVPLGSFSHAYEQANVILFLSSNSCAGTVTGNQVFSDGGVKLTSWINTALQSRSLTN